MRFQKLLISAATVFCLVGASGPAEAQGVSPESRLIIADFCEMVRNDAEQAERRLEDAEDDLDRCVEDFRDCRDGGLIGDGDPLVECLTEGLSCAARRATDGVEACIEFQEEFADSYERALREARFGDVEDEVQDFFNSRSRARRICLRPAVQIGRSCTQQSRPL
jgi:hypothetical protein